MNFKDFINNPILKKGLGYAGVVVAGVAAISNALSDQKKEKEFKELKEAVSELQKNK